MALVFLRDQLSLAFQLSFKSVEVEKKHDFQQASGSGSRTHKYI
jgi:hypothetical protein